MPPAPRQALGQRHLFILPSRLGWIYLCTALSVFLLGTNYQNNLILMLAFSMFSLFVMAMILTHRNLMGLVLVAGETPLADVGSAAPVVLTLTHPRECLSLDVRLGEQRVRVGLVSREAQAVTLPIPVVHRGLTRLPRLEVSSRFPLGLLRCWSLPDLGLSIWGAPQPVMGDLLDLDSGESPEAQPLPSSVTTALGDFSHMRDYQPGDPLSRVAWKQLAQGRGKLVKVFTEGGADSHRLDLNRVVGDLETRLSTLAFWIRQYQHQGDEWSLRLGARYLTADSGPAHAWACRMALAQHGVPHEPARR